MYFMKHKLKAHVARLKAWITSHKAISATGLVVLLAIIGVIVVPSSDNTEVSRTDVSNVAQVEDEVKPTTFASPLTGLQVSKEEANRPVTAIVIENSPDARPQSSLHEAGFVFESIAEGGITRYLAFYQESRPDTIGPVRSLRPYFSDWITTFDASIAHVGGSQAALAEIGPLGIKSLNQFTYGNTYIRTTDRFAPHNVYTDFDKLDTLNTQLNYTSSDFDTWPRKTPKPVATPKASEITVNISSFLYQSSYSWDKESNTYLRRIAGTPMTDRETKTRIAPSVVIVIETPFSIGQDGRYDYKLVGDGKATVFQDGNAQVGTWSKNARDQQISFTSDNGDEIELNPGQVWITVISPNQEVEYTP